MLIYYTVKGNAGLTTKEVADRCGCSPGTAMIELQHLHNKGFIVKSGIRWHY